MTRGLILASLLALLAGCIDDQERQVAACVVKSEGIYPQEPPLSYRRSHMEQQCMRASGYKFMCGSNDILADMSLCYEPSGDIDRWLYRLESWARGAL